MFFHGTLCITVYQEISKAGNKEQHNPNCPREQSISLACIISQRDYDNCIKNNQSHVLGVLSIISPSHSLTINIYDDHNPCFTSHHTELNKLEYINCLK